MAILCYHTVSPNWSSPLAVSPRAFARHAAWLKSRRRTIPLSEALAALNSLGELPTGLATITFDDGFASLYDHAFVVLREHQLPATIFVVAKTLEPYPHPVDWVDPPPTEPLATLSVEQILEMQDAGLHFGSHSYSHRDLTLMSERECEDDLRASRELLEDQLKSPIRHLAYPRGRHNDRVRRAAQRAGYTHAFASIKHGDSFTPYAVGRSGVYRGDGVTALRAKGSPWYLRAKRTRLAPLLSGLRAKTERRYRRFTGTDNYSM